MEDPQIPREGHWEVRVPISPSREMGGLGFPFPLPGKWDVQVPIFA